MCVCGSCNLIRANCVAQQLLLPRGLSQCSVFQLFQLRRRRRELWMNHHHLVLGVQQKTVPQSALLLANVPTVVAAKHVFALMRLTLRGNN